MKRLANISATLTEYHKYIPSYATNIKAKNYVNVTLYAILLTLFYIFFRLLRDTLVFPIFLVITGSILIIVGFRNYTIYNYLANTPFSNIRIATYGLNKIKGRFVTHNNQPLISPISGKKCVYYSISLWHVYRAGKRWIAKFLDGFDAGVPTLFTDGTGFLAIDLEKMPYIEVRANVIKVKTLMQQDKNRIVNEIMSYIRQAAKNNTQANLLNLANYLEFKESRIRNLKEEVMVGDLIKYMDAYLGLYVEGFYLLEEYIPLEENYIFVGGVANTGKTINVKSVKVAVPDISTGILSLFLEGKDIASSLGPSMWGYKFNLLLFIVIHILLGFILLVIGLLRLLVF